ncbi:hypothetical protein FOA43_000006 [Brettanomyces nanus]|uniref:Uncharacterized protein n=1 Tax=Eeniella nana TaxID=13502 RepID=A0A875RXI4_EENNA|nr:uncharacterized protein FOA43_000006 [Brettanomyces nanus]QPG72705.1 hypothetical protein FOA43_000006 [Brettanomyces nanus]
MTSKEFKRPLNEVPKHKKLVKKAKPAKPFIKTIWLVGHSLTLVMGSVYTSYFLLFRSHSSRISFYAYRLSLMGVMLSYCCTIASQFNKKSLPSYRSLLGTLNFQYLLLSVVWFFNRGSLFKIFPYLVVSTMQLASKFNVKPVLKLSSKLKVITAYDEVFIFVVLLVDVIFLRSTSGYALVIYAAMYWLRVIQSEDTRHLLFTVVGKLDSFMSNQKNPKVAESWSVVKNFLTAKNDRFQAEFLA